MISYYEPAFGVAALAEPLKLCPQGPDIATPLEVEANLASAHGDDLHWSGAKYINETDQDIMT